MSYQTLGKENVISALRERMMTMSTRCYASATIFQSKFKLSELCVSSQDAVSTRRYSAYTKLADLFWAKNGCQHYFRGEALQEVCGTFRIWLPPVVETYGDDLVVVAGFEALTRIIEEKKNTPERMLAHGREAVAKASQMTQLASQMFTQMAGDIAEEES